MCIILTKIYWETFTINKSLFNLRIYFIEEVLWNLETGVDLEKMLRREHFLDDAAGIKTLRKILQNIEKNSLVAKRSKYITIG